MIWAAVLLFNKRLWSLSMANWTYNYFTEDDWHFWGFGFMWSSNISLSRGVSWQHVLALTSVFPHWVGSCVKTSTQYICQYDSSLNVAGLIFSFPLWLPHSLFFFAFLLSFFLFLLFLESPSLGQGPSIFPQSRLLKVEPLFPATGIQGVREEAGWLPGCQLGVCVSVRNSRGDRCDDDWETVGSGDWFQLEIFRFVLYFSENSLSTAFFGIWFLVFLY